MKMKEFTTIAKQDPIHTLLKKGVQIATRTTFFCEVALYQVDNYYVEVFYTRKQKEIARIRTFNNPDQLTPYINKMDISKLFMQ